MQVDFEKSIFLRDSFDKEESLPLPNELKAFVLGLLEVSDLTTYACLNHQAHHESLFEMVKYAQKFGYNSDCLSKTHHYLRELYIDLQSIFKQQVVKKDYFCYDNRSKLHLEKTLEIFKTMPHDSVSKIFSWSLCLAKGALSGDDASSKIKKPFNKVELFFLEHIKLLKEYNLGNGYIRALEGAPVHHTTRDGKIRLMLILFNPGPDF